MLSLPVPFVEEFTFAFVWCKKLPTDHWPKYVISADFNKFEERGVTRACLMPSSSGGRKRQRFYT